MKEKPSIFKAVATALLGLIIFGLVYLLSYIIFGLIIYVMTLIPLLESLVDLLFYVRGDTPDLMLSILSPTLAYYCTKAALESINKNKSTFGLSCMIQGISLIVLHIVSIVLNSLSGAGILKNIVQVIVGFVFFFSGREVLASLKTESEM